MSLPNPSRSKVRSTLLQRMAVSAGVMKLDGILAAGAQCQEVQGSTVALLALVDLDAAVAPLKASLAERTALAAALLAAGNALGIEVRAASAALLLYEAAVGAIARGSAGVIAGAGLLARSAAPPAPLGNVTGVEARPGKALGEAVLRWPAVKGATGYAIAVCLTPASPAGPWNALGTGSARHRTVTTPAPGAQILARVAAVASDGTRSDWSDPILVTAR